MKNSLKRFHCHLSPFYCSNLTPENRFVKQRVRLVTRVTGFSDFATRSSGLCKENLVTKSGHSIPGAGEGFRRPRSAGGSGHRRARTRFALNKRYHWRSKITEGLMSLKVWYHRRSDITEGMSITFLYLWWKQPRSASNHIYNLILRFQLLQRPENEQRFK